MVNPTSKINATKSARKGAKGTVVKCSTRSTRRSVAFQRNLNANGHSTRLHITEQPAKKFYTCTAKTNRLRVGVCVPNPDQAPASMPVDLLLIYAKSQRLVEDQSILCTFSKIHALENGRGVFDFRIEEVSARHNRRTFAIKIQPRDQSFKPAYTTGIDVKSKIPPKRKRGTAADFEDESGHTMLPNLACGHTTSCNSCARFLEDTLMEIREMINTKLEDVICQIRNCDSIVREGDDPDMFMAKSGHGHNHGHSHGHGHAVHHPVVLRPPAVMPPPPPNMHMVPPPVFAPPSLPPMANGVAAGMNQIHISIGSHNHQAAPAPERAFQFLPVQSGVQLAHQPMTNPPSLQSDSSASSTPTSRSMSPDEEIEAYFKAEASQKGNIQPELIEQALRATS